MPQDTIDIIFYIVVAVLPGLSLILFFLFIRYHQNNPLAPNKKWQRVVIGNLLILMVLVTSLFCALESYYRFFYDSTDSFGLNRVTKRWFKRYYQYNNLKLRDNIDYKLKPNQHRRITFLGDSFTAGHGIKDVRQRFVNLIRGQNPSWEVHAMAANGWDTRSQLLQLQYLAQQGYQLDTVVLVYCLNDIADSTPENNRILRRIYQGYSQENFWVKYSYWINTFYYRYRANKDPDVLDYYHFVSYHYEGPVWGIQRQLLTNIAKITAQHGGKLLVVTFPFLHALGEKYSYHKVHLQLAQFWRQQQIPHLDLFPLYKSIGKEKLIVSPYDAHPNEQAHQMAAQKITQFLKTYK